MSNTIQCPVCGAESNETEMVCVSCGRSLSPTHKRLDIKWIAIGVLVMVGLIVIAGLILKSLGKAASAWYLVSNALAFMIGGFLVGRFSAGRTILEPALAALIAVAGSLLLAGTFSWMGLLTHGFGPFFAALLGGWLGEMIQGTV